MGPTKRLPPDKPPPAPAKKLRVQPAEASPPQSTSLLEPRRRPDVARIKARNKDTDIFTVKQTLRGFTKPEGGKLAWDECIKEMNRAIAEAYLLANFHVLRLLEDNKHVPKIDQHFYQKCLSIVTNIGYVIKGEDAHDWKLTRLQFNEKRADTTWAATRHLPQGWFQNAAKEMATNAANTFGWDSPSVCVPTSRTSTSSLSTMLATW